MFKSQYYSLIKYNTFKLDKVLSNTCLIQLTSMNMVNELLFVKNIFNL